MNPTAMVIAALIVLPAVGLVTWAWFAKARVEAQRYSFSGFEGLHCEIGPQAAHHAEGARWPIPG